MDATSTFLAFLHNAFAPGALVLVALWESDRVISEDGAKTLYAAIDQTAQEPEKSRVAAVFETFLDEYFSPKQGWLRFLVWVFVLTALSLLIALGAYVYRMPDLYPQLLSKGFLSQFVGNGIVVTFAVNCIVLSQYRHLVASFAKDSALRNIGLIALDLVTKAVVFTVLTAIVYVLFTVWGGAFTGDVSTALHAVPVTIREALLFRNLTSVYIYSLALSSFPVFVVVLIKLLMSSEPLSQAFRKLLYWLPLRNKPLRAASIVLAVFLGALAVVFSLLLWGFR